MSQAHSPIRLSRHEALLLTEAVRIQRAGGVRAFNERASADLRARLGDHDRGYVDIPHEEKTLMAAMNALNAASLKVSGVWGMYFDEMHAALRGIGGKSAPRHDAPVLRIDLEKRVNPEKRGEAITYEAVARVLDKLRKRSGAWRRKEFVPSDGYSSSIVVTMKKPSLLCRFWTHRFLKKTYVPLMNKAMEQADRMTPEAFGGVTEFLREHLDVICTFNHFGSHDDKMLDTFNKLGQAMWTAYGMDRVDRSLHYIRERIFKGDDERTAVALMGHEVSSRELMRWVLGQRLAGFNLLRMHGSLPVKQLGSAVENLLRVRLWRNLEHAKEISRYLRKEVSVSDVDPVLQYARLDMLREAIQVTRGIYGVHRREEPFFVQEDEVTGQIETLVRSLISRAEGIEPPPPDSPKPERRTDPPAIDDPSTAVVASGIGSSGLPGSAASMLPSVGAIAQQGALNALRIARGA